MAIVVSLRDMVDELQTLSHESSAYLKKSTGKVITIRDDDFDMVRSMGLNKIGSDIETKRIKKLLFHGLKVTASITLTT